MPITHVQSTPEISGQHNGTLVFGSNVGAGSLLVVTFGSYLAALPTGFTDTQGNTWQTAKTAGPSVGARSGLFYAENVIGGANTISFSMTGYRVARAYEFSGFTGTSLLDRTASATGATPAGTKSTGTTPATTVADTLAIAQLTMDNSADPTVDGSWTEIQEHTLFDTVPSAAAMKILSATGTVECSWTTVAASHNWAATLAVFGTGATGGGGGVVRGQSFRILTSL